MDQEEDGSFGTEGDIRVCVLMGHRGGFYTWKKVAQCQGIKANVKFALNMHHIRITLSFLLFYDPTVIILSDLSGGMVEYSPQEIYDIQCFLRYSNKPRHLLATYATFYWRQDDMHIWDNRGFAPLFGMSAVEDYGVRVFVPTPENMNPYFCMKDPSSPLWKDVVTVNKRGESIFYTHGYANTQYIPPGAISTDEDTTILAETTVNSCGYIVINHVEDNFTSLFVSNMPEYATYQNLGDAQFIHNAIMFLHNQKTKHTSRTLEDRCIEVIIHHVLGGSMRDEIKWLPLPVQIAMYAKMYIQTCIPSAWAERSDRVSHLLKYFSEDAIPRHLVR